MYVFMYHIFHVLSFPLKTNRAKSKLGVLVLFVYKICLLSEKAKKKTNKKEESQKIKVSTSTSCLYKYNIV